MGPQKPFWGKCEGSLKYLVRSISFIRGKEKWLPPDTGRNYEVSGARLPNESPPRGVPAGAVR